MDMTLEQRVSAVEAGVAALQASRGAESTERANMIREFRDMRAETRGWAEFAVKANNKVNEVMEFYKVIHADILWGNAKVVEHDQRFAQVDERLNRIDAKLDAHDERFDRIDQRFDRIDQRFEGIDQRFEGVDDLLRQILAKVS